MDNSAMGTMLMVALGLSHPNKPAVPCTHQDVWKDTRPEEREVVDGCFAPGTSKQRLHGEQVAEL